MFWFAQLVFALCVIGATILTSVVASPLESPRGLRRAAALLERKKVSGSGPTIIVFGSGWTATSNAIVG